MDDWTSVKSVLTVVQLGSLSAASKALGIHHTTVLRQIAALEDQLQTKLFERQSNRYVPTRAGKILASEAMVADTHLKNAVTKIETIKESNAHVLVITTFPEYVPLLTELIVEYKEIGSEISVLVRSDERLFALDRGEAQIAIRAGPKPTEPDYVAQLLERSLCTLCAHKDYVNMHGSMTSLSDIGHHQYVMSQTNQYTAPEMQWIDDNVPDFQVVLKTNNYASFESAIYSGLGIGPLPLRCLKYHPDVIPILTVPPPDEWATDIWIVTHIDRHWTEIVQGFLAFFKGHFNVGISHDI